MSEPTVDVLAATVADLKAKGWITNVVASLLIEAASEDRAAVAELIAQANAAATRLWQSDNAADRQAGDDLIAAIIRAGGAK